MPNIAEIMREQVVSMRMWTIPARIRRARRSAVHLAAVMLLMTVSLPVRAEAAPQAFCIGRPATILGTEHNDWIVGTPEADVIVAGAGNDAVIGVDGDDIICGGAGNDWLTGWFGSDRIDGGPGRDVCDVADADVWCELRWR